MDHLPAGSGAGRGHRIELIPNCALTPRMALAFFASLVVVSFSTAGVFAARGLWPVLPFAGLEMALLGWALHASLRRRGWTQTITVTDEVVLVVTRDQRGERVDEFPRHWARTRLAAAPGWQPSRLLIESHGRDCEVGRLLTEEERRGVHARLRALVGGTAESPPLPAAG